MWDVSTEYGQRPHNDRTMFSAKRKNLNAIQGVSMSICFQQETALQQPIHGSDPCQDVCRVSGCLPLSAITQTRKKTSQRESRYVQAKKNCSCVPQVFRPEYHIKGEGEAEVVYTGMNRVKDSGEIKLQRRRKKKEKESKPLRSHFKYPSISGRASCVPRGRRKWQWCEDPNG